MTEDNKVTLSFNDIMYRARTLIDMAESQHSFGYHKQANQILEQAKNELNQAISTGLDATVNISLEKTQEKKDGCCGGGCH